MSEDKCEVCGVTMHSIQIRRVVNRTLCDEHAVELANIIADTVQDYVTKRWHEYEYERTR